jgi:hypothetical protein
VVDEGKYYVVLEDSFDLFYLNLQGVTTPISSSGIRACRYSQPMVYPSDRRGDNPFCQALVLPRGYHREGSQRVRRIPRYEPVHHP